MPTPFKMKRSTPFKQGHYYNGGGHFADMGAVGWGAVGSGINFSTDGDKSTTNVTFKPQKRFGNDQAGITISGNVDLGITKPNNPTVTKENRPYSDFYTSTASELGYSLADRSTISTKSKDLSRKLGGEIKFDFSGNQDRGPSILGDITLGAGKKHGWSYTDVVKEGGTGFVYQDSPTSVFPDVVGTDVGQDTEYADITKSSSNYFSGKISLGFGNTKLASGSTPWNIKAFAEHNKTKFNEKGKNTFGLSGRYGAFNSKITIGDDFKPRFSIGASIGL